MGTRDARVDAYIAKSADFAKPILSFLREAVHDACPEVEETMKWSFPHFMYHGMLCSMASFKQHCAFGFWKASLILPPGKSAGEEAMGHFGRITCLADLPAKRTLAGYLKKAVRLNEAGVKVVRATPKPKGPLRVPAELARVLQRNKRAQAGFDDFSPSQRREYVEWISEAKSDETRQRRLVTAVAWMAEGKTRHWEYAKK